MTVMKRITTEDVAAARSAAEHAQAESERAIADAQAGNWEGPAVDHALAESDRAQEAKAYAQLVANDHRSQLQTGTAELTADDVAAARSAAEHALAESDRAWKAATADDYIPGARDRLMDATVRAEHAQRRARQLAAEYDAQQQLLPLRQAAEKAVADLVKRRSTELAASRDRTVAAIVATEKAMQGMVVALTEHADLIRRTDAELIERGVPVADALSHAHDTGGSGRGSVRLRGEWWVPLDPGTALMASVYAVSRAVWGPANQWVRGLQYSSGYASVQRQHPDLAARIEKAR